MISKQETRIVQFLLISVAEYKIGRKNKFHLVFQNRKFVAWQMIINFLLFSLSAGRNCPDGVYQGRVFNGLRPENEILVKNPNFWLKIEILVKHRNFDEKSKFWRNIDILVKNGNFGEKSKFWWKIQILVKNPNFGEKSKFWGKIEILGKIENFD